jgi:putative PIN family toxin of toxin-antitoxin system
LKIVIDTNVLISALIFPGVSAEIFDFVAYNHEIWLSEWLIKEFSRKCRDKLQIPADALGETLKHLGERVNIAIPKGEKPKVCRDPDDDNVLWVAKSVEAEILITGDQDLLVLKEFEGTLILSPRGFKARYMTH